MSGNRATQRALAVLAVSAAVLLSPVARAEDQASGPSRVTRAFVLENLGTREAASLLRSKLQIRQVAAIERLGVLVVRDTRETVARAESLLRGGGAVARVVTPREPADAGAAGGAVEMRVLAPKGLETRDAVAVLRAIFGIKELRDLGSGRGIVVRADAATLDAAESLLSELGGLDDAGG